MVRDIFIPATGMARDDVILETWLKQPGDQVSAGDVVAVVETSKAVLDVQADASGVLGDHLVAEQQAVPPGTTIAHVLQEGDPLPDARPNAPATTAATPTSTGAPAPTSVAGPGAGSGAGSEAASANGTPIATIASTSKDAALLVEPRHRVSPRARRLAAEEAARPAVVTAPPVPATVLRPPPPPPPIRTGPPVPAGPSTPAGSTDRYRQAVAAAVSQSWREIPHFAVTREVRMTKLARAYGKARVVLPGLTVTDLLLRALALAFLATENRTDLDIGLAVATDQGVAIPVIRRVPLLDLVELSTARRNAVERAKTGRITADDAGDPVTTLSNLGALGVDQFTGIVPVGQTSLVTVGRLAERPVVKDGRIRTATTMHVTVNADHRTWDGRNSAELLDRFADITAEPALLLGFGPLSATTHSTREKS